MPKNLKRYYGQKHLHFVTCSCYRRLPLLQSVLAKNIVVKTLAEVRDGYGFALVGYVVMPEHIHLLMSEPARGTPSTVLQVLKQRVSRELRQKKRRHAGSAQLDLNFEEGEKQLRQFWQSRFHDFNVWSNKRKVQKLEYMHMNPVKRKLVASPKEWPWSSFGFYASGERGLVEINPR